MPHDSPTTNCHEEVGFIGAYLTGDLSSTNHAAFEKHLSDCPDCAAFLQTYKKTIEITRGFLRLQPALLQPPKLILRRPSIQPSSRAE